MLTRRHALGAAAVAAIVGRCPAGAQAVARR